MILAQTIPYLRDGDVFTQPVQRGQERVDSELTAASLRHDAVEAVHFLLARTPSPSIEALAAQFGATRVSLKTLTDWPELARAHEYVLVARPTLVDAFARARAFDQMTYPIFCLLDRVPNPHWLIRVLSLLLFAREGDALVVPSAAGRQAVQAMLEQAIDLFRGRTRHDLRPELQLVTMPIGIDERCFATREKAWCRDMLDLPRSCQLVLYIGRITDTDHADLELLLTIVSSLRAAHPDLFLLIAGRESQDRYIDVLRRQIIACGLTSHVRLWPGFHDALKPLLYNAADICVAPSDNVQEVFGLALLEAAASGLPVIASDWSGNRELVQHGVTGLLVPARWSTAAAIEARTLMPVTTSFIEHYLSQRTIVDPDALARALDALLANEAVRRAMGDRARAQAEAYRWRSVIGAYGALWRDQLARARGAQRRSVPAWRLNYSRAFRHFATATSDTTDRVRCSSSGRAWLDSHSGPDAERVADVFGRCAREAQPIDALLSPNDPARHHTVWWLLKRGYLERIATTREGRIDDHRTDVSVPACEESVLER